MKPTRKDILRTLFWTGRVRSRLIMGMLFYPITLAPFIIYAATQQGHPLMWVGVAVSVTGWAVTWWRLYLHAARYTAGETDKGPGWDVWFGLLAILTGWFGAIWAYGTFGWYGQR